MSDQEQLNLWAMTKHPGFDVLVALMDDAVRESAADPIRLDPVKTENYPMVLERLALTARATNDFCMSLRNAVMAHVNAAAAKQKEDEEEAKLDEETDKIQSTIRLLTLHDNEQ
jgi:hypothetical protein